MLKMNPTNIIQSWTQWLNLQLYKELKQVFQFQNLITKLTRIITLVLF